MNVLRPVIIAAVIAGSSPAHAQTGTPIDCSDPANAENEVCLPGTAGVTNFAPLIAGVVGLLGLGALAGGGGSTSATTTSTN